MQNVFLRFYVDFFDVDANDWINGGVYIQYNNRLVVRGALKEGRTDERSGCCLRRDGFSPFHYAIDYRSSCSYGSELVGTKYVVRDDRSPLETEFAYRKATDEFICQGRIFRVNSGVHLFEKKVASNAS